MRIMKRYLFAMIATLLIPVLQGCDDEEAAIENILKDYPACEIVIHVENSNGENLLMPETPGYIVPEDVTANYKGKVYKYTYAYEKDGKPYPFKQNTEWDDPGYEKSSNNLGIKGKTETRVNYGTWYGLHDGYTMNWEPTINFGEFSPNSDYHNEEFEVRWPDGSSDKIAFDLYIDESNGEEVYTKNLYLNGNPVDAIIIVK